MNDDVSIGSPQLPPEPPHDGTCPLGVCDGSGLWATSDEAGRRQGVCCCVPAPPGLRDQVLAEIRWCAGTERLMAALADEGDGADADVADVRDRVGPVPGRLRGCAVRGGPPAGQEPQGGVGSAETAPRGRAR